MKKHLAQILTSGTTGDNIMLFIDCLAIIILGYSQLSLKIIEIISVALLAASVLLSIKTKGLSIKSIFHADEKFANWRLFVEAYIYIALFYVPDENPLIRHLIADVTIALLFGMIVYGYIYMSKKQLEQRDSIENLTGEINSIMAQKGSVDRETIKKIFRRQFAAVDRLAAVRYESGDEKTLNKNYAREAKRMISELEPNSAEMAELKQYVDSTRDNLISRFEESYPNLNPYYYQLFLYTAIGLSPRAMSVLFDIPVETIYNRKSRLKNIIGSAETADRAQFLEAIV